MNNTLDPLKILVPEELTNLYPLQSLVFIDIETTGFSARYHQIINIGLLYYDSQWRFTQYWASTIEEEKQMLLQFLTFDLPSTLYICYNGKTFDIPFILNRVAFHKLPTINLRHRVLDYISLGRSFSKENQLSSYSFKALELFLGFNRVNDVAGEDVIHAFHAYLATSNPTHKKAILKHNERDVMHMPEMLTQLSKEYGPQLTQIIPIVFKLKEHTFALHQRNEKGLLILSGDLSPDIKIPIEVVAGLEISIHKRQVQIKLPMIDLKLDNHFFRRLDWNLCSESQIAYDNLAISDKTKLIFEIDGILQIQSLIDYLTLSLMPWIK
jgi:hypothetical protein